MPSSKWTAGTVAGLLALFFGAGAAAQDGKQVADQAVTSVLRLPPLTAKQHEVLQGAMTAAGAPRPIVHLTARGDGGRAVAVDQWSSSTAFEQHRAAMRQAFASLALSLELDAHPAHPLTPSTLGAWCGADGAGSTWLLTLHTVPPLTREQIDQLHQAMARERDAAPPAAANSNLHLASSLPDGGFQVVDLWASREAFEAADRFQARINSQVKTKAPSVFEVYRNATIACGTADRP